MCLMSASTDGLSHSPCVPYVPLLSVNVDGELIGVSPGAANTSCDMTC